MKLTIGAKLGAGFGTIIALLAICAGTAYYNISAIQANLADVLDNAVPTIRRCDRLMSHLNQASATLRGFLAVDLNTKQAVAFKTENAAAWDQVDAELAQLSGYVAAQNNAAEQQRVDALARLAREQRGNHQHILQLASADDNVPAERLLQVEITPRVEQSLDLMGDILKEEATLEATSERKKLLAALAEFRESYARTTGDLRGYVSSGNEDTKRAFSDDWQRSEAGFQALVGPAGKFTPTQKQQWQRAVALHEELAPLSTQIIRLREAEDWNRAEHFWTTTSLPIGKEFRSLLAQITSAAEERSADERHQLDAASRTTLIALTTATVISIVIGCAVAILLSRRMVTTVRSLADRAKQISEGDLRGTAIVTRGADELSHLADGFNVMLSNLRDLTGQVLTVTENVNSAASQISSSAKQQASSTKEQAATVQEITSTMQEISQSGAQIVAKAKEVAAVAEQASSASKSGIDAVQNTNRTMEAIREQVEEVAENIVALSEKTQAVGEIIATVNEIAEQSNLLALNATIEAAEAGTEGSRFSVVAAEMKNLADQAKECTVHVRKILGEIQKAINTSVMLTEEAVKRVESGKVQADVSENVIRQISSTTDESIEAFQQIIGATNQQQIGLEQVARGMQDIDQAAQQTATGTGQLEQAVVSLSALSKQLRTAVASYKV